MLLRRLIEGDERAFEEFAETYIPALMRFALRRLDGDRELASDIVQNTIVKAIAKLETFRGEAALMTWLCACCRSEIAGHFRRPANRAVEVELTEVRESLESPLGGPPPDGPERTLIREETAGLVHVALDLLPSHYGQVLEWKYLEELPVKEIARRLGGGAKAAESLLTRARQSFRTQYDQLLADRPPTDGESGGRLSLEGRS